MDEYEGTRGQERAINYGEAKMNAPDRKRLIDMLEEADMQAEKLLQMINELGQRLEPLRREDMEMTALKQSEAQVKPPTLYGSPWAAKLDGSIQMVRTAQARIAVIMADLDI